MLLLIWRANRKGFYSCQGVARNTKISYNMKYLLLFVLLLNQPVISKENNVICFSLKSGEYFNLINDSVVKPQYIEIEMGGDCNVSFDGDSIYPFNLKDFKQYLRSGLGVPVESIYSTKSKIRVLKSFVTGIYDYDLEFCGGLSFSKSETTFMIISDFGLQSNDTSLTPLNGYKNNLLRDMECAL